LAATTPTGCGDSAYRYSSTSPRGRSSGLSADPGTAPASAQILVLTVLLVGVLATLIVSAARALFASG
jgi:hypothetical protein